MSRKMSREFSMQMLFQMEIQKEDRGEQLATAFEESESGFSKKDREYIENVVSGVFEKLPAIDELIERNAKGWKLQRMSRIDLSILRLCLYEIMYRDDIPFTVSVNEAVELAKKYGTEDSASFINGILSNASPDAQKQPGSAGEAAGEPAGADAGDLAGEAPVPTGAGESEAGDPADAGAIVSVAAERVAAD